MKQLLLTTIAAVVLVGCGESQQSVPAPEVKPAEPVAEAAQPETPTTKAPDIPLWEAAYDGNIEAVKQHLAAAADVNAKKSPRSWPSAIAYVGQTPLHIAAINGHKEVTELLIANGADMNAKNNHGRTPLDAAVFHPEIADLIRKHGGKHGTIHGAADGGDIEAVKKFLAAGTDVNVMDNMVRTPLHRAAENDRKQVAELLIAEGADVNAKGDDGTPLQFAAIVGSGEIVELLIANGADVSAKDNDGKTPLDWANQYNHTEIANLLRKHGGKTGEELKAEGK